MLQRLTRSLKRSKRSGPAPLILMYHRVAELASDPWGLAISPRDFRAHLDFLRSRRTPLDLATFVALLRAQKLPPDAVAISFDDGYADNLLHALPALANAGLNATLFVSTGAITTQLPFWWDELAALVLDCKEPAEIEVTVGSTRFEAKLGDREADDMERGAWRAWEPPRTRREACYVGLWKALRKASAEQRGQAMATLRALLGPAPDRETDRPLTIAELRSLARSGTFAMGGHTVSHPPLPELDPGAQRREIAEGRSQLEAIIGSSIEGFAYPYGAMDQASRRAVADCGFRWACSTESNMVDRVRFDPFALPRIAAPAGSEAMLEHSLAALQ
jgi:peptidoglycan/xylan/chitin deacetylase (PgdA/CDA1 family)